MVNGALRHSWLLCKNEIDVIRFGIDVEVNLEVQRRWKAMRMGISRMIRNTISQRILGFIVFLLFIDLERIFCFSFGDTLVLR